MENQLKEFEELLVDYFAGNLSEEDSRRLCTLMKSDRIYRQKYEEMAKVRAKSFVPRFENEKTNYAELVSELSMHPNRKHSTFSTSVGISHSSSCIVGYNNVCDCLLYL